MNRNFFGLELEFGGRCPDITLSEILGINLEVNSIYLIDYSEWSISEDCTADSEDLVGLEIRSPKFTEFPREELRQHCHHLSENGCRPTRTSGIHFHFSGPEFAFLQELPKVTLTELSKRLFCIGAPHKEREKYCLPNTDFSIKRSALRLVNDNHWECRVFNSTLDVCLIEGHFHKMLEVINEYV